MKIRIVLEGLRGEESIAELCRREGVAPNLYYRWSKEFLEAGDCARTVPTRSPAEPSSHLGGFARIRVAPGWDGQSRVARLHPSGFERRGERRFSMVVGAEGIHSRTRDLVFGPENRFERFLGYGFAAFVLDGYRVRSPDVYVMHGEPGRQAARFALRDGSTLVLLIWRDDRRTPIPHESAAQKALICDRFAGGKWELPALLAGLDAVDDLYVDRVSQIRMDRWHEARIGLVGDCRVRALVPCRAGIGAGDDRRLCAGG